LFQGTAFDNRKGGIDMDAYGYPLLIKQLLVTSIAQRSRKEIVYRDQRRFGYPELIARIGRLGSALAARGVGAGSTVAVMDWDSHRYLECYFAIPMLGATLMTTNIRLSPEQIAYTLDHSGAEVLLVNTDFLPLLATIRSQLPKVRQVICLSDDGMLPPDMADSVDYEQLVESGNSQHAFPDMDENTRATLYYTTGTTGAPKGVFFSHRQLVLHSITVLASVSQATENGRFSRNDVYMPLTPMFHAHAWGYPYIATLCGWKQVYPGRFDPSSATLLAQKEGVTFSHCVPTILDMVLSAPESHGVDFGQWKVLIGGSALPRAGV
jgi:fatty-acyl-CoA synthase